MPAARILVVEDDPNVQHPLRAVLHQYGYEVISAADGVEGLRMARAYQPDLMIVDVMMPNMDGWTMLQQIRAQPEFALVPAIFLTALPVQDTMVESFKLGGLDYIPKPFRFEDVINKVAQALHRRDQVENVLRARTAASTPPTALRSALDQVGLASLLSVMEMEKKSGMLTISRSLPAAVGVIAIRDGRVVRGDIPGNPPLSGPPAIYEMLSWQSGQAEFQPVTVEGPDTINSSTTHLLMEGARLVDERRRLANGF
jgi:CheY-like chemotaxis protein